MAGHGWYARARRLAVDQAFIYCPFCGDISGDRERALLSLYSQSREWQSGTPTMLENLDKPILVALCVYALIALILTRGVIVDPGLTIFQKIAQAMIVWLIPVLGLCVVLFMQGNNHTRAEMRKLVPFPFYLAAPAVRSDGSLASSAQDGAGDYCGLDAADGD